MPDIGAGNRGSRGCDCWTRPRCVVRVSERRLAALRTALGRLDPNQVLARGYGSGAIDRAIDGIRASTSLPLLWLGAMPIDADAVTVREAR
jgi:hypothetical protein